MSILIILSSIWSVHSQLPGVLIQMFWPHFGTIPYIKCPILCTIYIINIFQHYYEFLACQETPQKSRSFF